MTSLRIINKALFCLYLTAVCFLCFGKPEDMPQMQEFWFGLPSDKVCHFLMFAPFPFLAYHSLKTKEMSLSRRLLTLGIIVLSGIGLSIATEQIQALTAYREADIMDFYTDCAGLMTSGAAMTLLIIYRRNK